MGGTGKVLEKLRDETPDEVQGAAPGVKGPSDEGIET